MEASWCGRRTGPLRARQDERERERGTGPNAGEKMAQAGPRGRALLGCGEFDAGRNGPDAGSGLLGQALVREGMDRARGVGYGRGRRGEVSRAGPGN